MATDAAATGTGASRDGATTPGNAAAATDAGAGAASGEVGIAVAGGAGAITDGTGGAMLGTQAGASASAGSDERTEVPPSTLARLASEASDARKNAAWDSAMAR